MKETCPYCKGSGKTFFSDNKNYTCPSCNGKGYIDVGWDKEFEDEVYVTDMIHGTIMPYTTGYPTLNKLFEEYLGCDYKLEIEKGKRKVKIKCKDGCIQIERM